MILRYSLYLFAWLRSPLDSIPNPGLRACHLPPYIGVLIKNFPNQNTRLKKNNIHEMVDRIRWNTAYPIYHFMHILFDHFFSFKTFTFNWDANIMVTKRTSILSNLGKSHHTTPSKSSNNKETTNLSRRLGNYRCTNYAADWHHKIRGCNKKALDFYREKSHNHGSRTKFELIKTTTFNCKWHYFTSLTKQSTVGIILIALWNKKKCLHITPTQKIGCPKLQQSRGGSPADYRQGLGLR